MLFRDQNKILWGCHKSNDGKYLQKITTLKSIYEFHDVFVTKNKQYVVLSNENGTTIHIIANINESLQLIKKLSINLSSPSFNTYIKSFEYGILTIGHQKNKEVCFANCDTFEHISLDIDTEKIVGNFENTMYFEPILNPPLEAILASIADTNSKNDKI